MARLLKAMRSMQSIITVISKSINNFVYLALLLIFFIFIYSLLGMQTYGSYMDYGEGPPRLNFDTFNSAFVTVFVVLTMENWFVVLYDCLRTEQVNQVITIIYLVSWIFIGNFILLNLFLAILLESFSDCETDEAELTPDEMI